MLNNIDSTIRDAEIQAFWEGLSFTKKSYKDKIDILMTHYYISEETIKNAIYKNKHRDR